MRFLIVFVLIISAPLMATEPTLLMKIVGESNDDLLGYSVADAGDVNGDGLSDIIIGAPGYSEGTNEGVGAVYIYFGGSPMDSTYDVKIVGEYPSDHFGASVSSAGDVNGDGYDDIIVGAPDYDFMRGAAYVFYGGPAMDSIWDIKMVGEGSPNAFGFSVAGLGDINGDYYADFIVGANYYSEPPFYNRGAAYVYFGGPNPDSICDLKLVGEDSLMQFGYSVSTAGDVNMDGFFDIIVGAPEYGYGGGAAYIFLGGTTPDTIYDIKLPGYPWSHFGASVSHADDFDGYGFDDVIVGAPDYPVNGVAIGAAFIFKGGDPMDSICDYTLVGENEYDWFGSSVSGAGDLNRDGVGDVIVGAYNYSDSVYYRGAAYIFFGDSTNFSIKIVGEGEDDVLGSSVSRAGNVNGDKYDDFLIGAKYYEENNISPGAAYLYSAGNITGVNENTKGFTTLKIVPDVVVRNAVISIKNFTGKIQIMDIAGRVRKEIFSNSEGKYLLSSSLLEPGIYFAVARRADGRTEVVKFQVIK